MKTLKTYFFPAFIAGFLACGSLMAGTMTPNSANADLPDGDTDQISIQLNPLNGALDGTAGATVGWGFTVGWAPTDGDWLVFTGSSLDSPDEAESNPGILEQCYGFYRRQGGPFDFGLEPALSPWQEAFNPGATPQALGVGS
jgi:hypothetical protein